VWKGQTYVSFSMPGILKELIGGPGDGYLWAADARTLIFDTEKAIKAQIEAKTSNTFRAAPDYAAGWDTVSRCLFALALDNRGRRIFDRSITKAELEAALSNKNDPEYHATGLARNTSQLVAGVAGDDDFRFDLRATADSADAAAEVARSFEALLAEAKKAKADDGTDDVESAVLGFLRRVAEHTTVQRDAAVVTVHGETASGFNQLVSTYVKDLTSPEKEK
jgi:hypothetical protein